MNLKPNHGHLGRKQRAVINDLLNGVNRFDSLAKNNVRPAHYRKWIKNKLFRRELIERIDAQKRQAKYVMVHFYPHAAEKLAKLIDSDKPETARKACSEIIALHSENAVEQSQKEEVQNQPMKISDDKAERMLAILAEDEKPAAGQPVNGN